MSKILIIDDHSVVRMAVRMLLESLGHEIVGEADNGVDGISITRKLQPDLVILDIDIPQFDGLEVLKRIFSTGEIKVLIFSTVPAERFVSRCIEGGASGFVRKSAEMDELKNAIAAVLAGYTFFPQSSSFHNAPSSADALSSRELLVLRMLANGLRNIEIAEQLKLSEKTISTYKARIIKKLGLKSIVDLLEFAKSNGLS